MSENLPRHWLFYVTTNIYFCFYFNTARDVVTVLLIFVNIYHFSYTFLHAHTEAHTQKHTCMISTQEEWRQPGAGAWLGGTEEGRLLETKALHTHPKCQQKKIQAHRASSKDTRLFLTN